MAKLTSKIDELIETLKKEGKVVILSREESQRIDSNIEKKMIEAVRISERNQILSERESNKIIFNF